VEAFVPDGMDEGQVAFHIVLERALVLPSPATRDLDVFARSLQRLRNLPLDAFAAGV
jgi:hypothetical protein